MIRVTSVAARRGTNVAEDRPFQRTPSPQTAGWFLDLHEARTLDLDPPYQRRSVWNLEFRRFFVDSVIRNYPTQSIFLDVNVNPDADARQRTTYRVLDGKQRLTSLISFTEGEFATPESLADVGLDEKYYDELPRDVRTRVLSYLFTVESVTNVTAAELNQAFDRLNRNVSRLNKQELRHAQYGGEFITKMENLASDAFWEEIGLVTPARRRRMLDVEYISEFYVVAARGIQDGKDYLDSLYAEFDTEIEDERASDRRFRAAKTFLEKINGELPLAGTRYKNVADFYSLWAAVLRLIEADDVPAYEDIAARLAEFQTEVDADQTAQSRRYVLAARQGSNKSSNRELRASTLVDVMLGR